MVYFNKFILLVVLLQHFTPNVSSETTPKSNSTDATENVNGRRSNGILIVDSSANADGQRVTSQKVETKTFTSSLSSSGGASSAGLRGWVSEPQVAGVVYQPQLQGVIQTQQGCQSGSGQNNNILSTASQASVLRHKSTASVSQSFNGGSAVNSLTSHQNQWQSGQNGLRGSLVIGQGGQSSVLHGTSSHSTANNVNDLRGAIVTGNSQGVNIFEATNNIQRGNIFNPEHSYKVVLSETGDGIYVNELKGQQAQNMNLRVPTESNSPHIVAVPVTTPQFGRVQGYRPNIQYYLSQIEASKLKSPLTIFKVPSFIDHIKTDQTNVNLSEEQLNIYKQYLIQTGLIKLKPYQLIFSDQFKPKLRTLQWMVVPLESNWEFCRQQCGNIFTGNNLYTGTENTSKLPLRLLVPVLKVRSGLGKTVASAQTIAGGVGDISDGVYRTAQDAPSEVNGILNEKSGETNNKS